MTLRWKTALTIVLAAPLLAGPFAAIHPAAAGQENPGDGAPALTTTGGRMDVALPRPAAQTDSMRMTGGGSTGAPEHGDK
jgi:hypothetical protein